MKTVFQEQFAQFDQSQRNEWAIESQEGRRIRRQASDITGIPLWEFVTGKFDEIRNPDVGVWEADRATLSTPRYDRLSRNTIFEPNFAEAGLQDFVVFNGRNDDLEINLGNRSQYVIRGSRGRLNGTSIFSRSDNGLDLVAVIVGESPAQLRDNLLFQPE